VTTAETPIGDQPATKGDLQSEKWSVNLVTLVTGAASLLGMCVVLFGAGWFVIDRAEAHAARAADAGISPFRLKQEILAGELARHVADEAAQRARLERKIDRLDEQQVLVLDALRVPLDKRPPQIDAGHP